jgi:hypothetical protein
MAKVGARQRLQCIGITEAQIKKLVRLEFPKLKTGFKVTSCPDNAYNCIAWAAGDTTKFWWPIGGYWPDGVPRDRTVSAFIKAFETEGYVVCDDVRYELGYEKIAIYTKDGKPTHAARQIADSKWTSKLGKFADISHRLIGVENDEYGKKEVTMKRKKPT